MNQSCQTHKSHTLSFPKQGSFPKQRRTRTNSSKKSPTSPRIKQVNLTVKCETITDNYWLSQHVESDSQFLTSKNIIPLTTEGDIDFAALKSRGTRPIFRWPLPRCNCRKPLIVKILSNMIRLAQSVSPQHDIELDLLCEVVIRKDNHISDVDEWVMQRSFEEKVPKFVPASDSSIKSLRRTIVVEGDDDGGSENCSVCFEDFLAGNEVLCMPCSHVYHQDCIGEWLRTSHFCPNCRYAMPTD